jgi:hypothetical protein
MMAGVGLYFETRRKSLNPLLTNYSSNPSPTSGIRIMKSQLLFEYSANRMVSTRRTIMNEKTVTRASACHKIADCWDPNDLLNFLSHPNKHPRKAALHKIVRLHTGIAGSIKTPSTVANLFRSRSGVKDSKTDVDRDEALRSFLTKHGYEEVANLLFPKPQPKSEEAAQ